MTFSSIILYAAKSVGVSGSLLLAICTFESKLVNTISPHDNGSPSYGICQIKESTARMLGFNGQREDLMNPSINAKYAALYLKKQLERYDGDLCMATAAYNAGTYNPSKIVPGKPKNLKYVKGVTLHLDDQYKDMLICGPRKVEE